MIITLITIIALTLLIIFYAIAIFNNLVKLKNRFKNAFAQIDVQLKRRYDLIPNLIEVAKKYLAHEKDTLESITRARSGAQDALSQAAQNPGDPSLMKNLAGAEKVLSESLGKFNLVMEAYPDLKANQNMMQLSEELISTENKISFARQAYNDEVMRYNTYKQSFPQIILAGAFGHGQDSALLEFADADRIKEVPKITF
jgi:LemA protein